jgi:hypothetical protein
MEARRRKTSALRLRFSQWPSFRRQHHRRALGSQFRDHPIDFGPRGCKASLVPKSASPDYTASKLGSAA